MALLHIAEPGQSPLPHEAKRAVGIDLGTTNSLVATMRGGRVVALPDESGNISLSSVVNYSEPDKAKVGVDAIALAVDHPADTLASVKRFMGRGHQDALEEAERSHYKLSESSEHGMVGFLTSSGLVSPVEASGEILAALRDRAEHNLGGAIDGAVITVPA